MFLMGIIPQPTCTETKTYQRDNHSYRPGDEDSRGAMSIEDRPYYDND